ncbi:MAG: helix-turn-helix domain-containing protein [Candidatus Parvarchaeota archaeon]|nr:helix-turn-helix domain-containing protein [Candidatus Parvarchaeota archaeon]MCL5107185.1 helix-turn-helix domain-containing protein [Candidatus Parvarchaeota archaeon]
MSELFCSKVMSEIIPSFRAIIANKLLEKGMTQKDVSKLLGITQPAISQYKSGLRGLITEKMTKNEKFMEYLNEITYKVYSKNLDINLKTCEICKATRDFGVIKEKEIKEFLCLLQIAGSR